MATLRIVHELPIAADRFWELLHDPAYEAFQAAGLGLGGYEEVERRVEGSVMHRRIRVVPKIEVPAAIRKVIGAGDKDAGSMGYIESQEKQLDRYEMRWWVDPPILVGKLQVGGLFRLEPIDATRCRRILDGEVKIGIPIVGGTVEKFVLQEVKKTYDKVPGIVAAWVRQNP
jgi:hypothetical protein